MDKYGQMNRFNYDRQLQVYIYDSMFFDPDIIEEGDYFLATIFF